MRFAQLLIILAGAIIVPRSTVTAAEAADKMTVQRDIAYAEPQGSDKETQKDASPITHVAKDKGIPPFLIIHVADRAESKAQSHEFAEALRKAGVAADVVPAEGKTHGSLSQELGQPGDKPTKAVLAFLDRLK